jgi:hypothetical protein
VDYWGLSYRKGLEYILAHDPRQRVRVAVDESPGRLTAIILKPWQRERLCYCGADEADYFLTCFRFRSRELPPRQPYYAVRAGGATVLLVDKLR